MRSATSRVSPDERGEHAGPGTRVGIESTETPFFFERGDAQLFGIVHEPVKASDTAFLMSHPFGEEKLWSHRVFVSFARELARRGHAVLRFDYLGAGDSTGSTADTSLETHLADLGGAYAWLRDRQPAAQRVGLIGLRFGATVAALFAERMAGDARIAQAPLVLWDPVVDGDAYFQELLRSNLSTQLAVYGKVIENRDTLSDKIRSGATVNVDGYDIGRALFEDGSKINLASAGHSHSGPVLVTQIAAGATAKLREDLQGIASAYPRGTFQRCTEQPFWREIKPFYGRASDLQKSSLDWLEQAHG